MNSVDFDDLQEVSIESLEFLAANVSLENLTSLGSHQSHSKRLGQFFKGAQQFFSKFKLSPLGNVQLSVPETKGVLDSVTKRGFVDASNKTVIVPEGFVGKWVPYAEELRSAMVTATQVIDMVGDFNSTLGKAVNDPEILKSVTGIGYEGMTEVGLNSQMMHIGKTFFDGKSNHIRRDLGAVVDRTQDIQTAHKLINAVAAIEKATDPAKTLKAVDRTIELGSMLMEHVDSDGKVSKAAINEIVEVTLSIAKEVEAYGTLIFRIRQFSLSLKDSVKELKK